MESMEKNLDDVAGIRIICSFLDDIYEVADMLIRQDDVKVIAVKDYIQNPKPNGYRSYHMIIEIPVFFLSLIHILPISCIMNAWLIQILAASSHPCSIHLRYPSNRWRSDGRPAYLPVS